MRVAMVRAATALLLVGCASASEASGRISGRVLRGGRPLYDAFVWVKAGLGDRTFPVPSDPVVVDQRDYEFHPHVLGIRAGQPLRVHSSDAAHHNVNCQPFDNDGFNVMMMDGEAVTRTFPHPEIMILLKCDLHPHMKAWVGVVDHPWFAVTGEDGRFAFDGLPPGRYVVAAWEERSGTRERAATLGETVEIRYPDE